MKVLLTGAGGQMGRTLAATLPYGIRAVGVSRADLDVGDQSAVARILSAHAPELIINCAASTAVDAAEQTPEAAFRVNAEGPRYLAEISRSLGCRLIHLSTDFVFDGRSSVPYRPQSITNPQNVYGASKRAGEEAVLATLGDHCIILRTAWLYSAHGSNFVLTMLRLMRTRETVRVIQDQVGTPTSTRSLAEVIWKLAITPDISGIHHWTDAGVASWYDFAVAIAEEGAELGLVSRRIQVVPITTEDYLTPARRPAYSVLDKTSLQSLGAPPTHWRSRLRAVLQEIRHA